MSKKDKINETVSSAVDEVITETVDDTAGAKKSKTNMKKFKYGSMSIAVICLVVAIVVIINIMVGMLAKRSPIKIDITPDKRYDLSDESVEVLTNLSDDVDIVVTMQKDTFTNLSNYYESMYGSYGYNTEVPYDMIPTLLEKYEMYAQQSSGSIKVKYVDMDKDPDVISKYSASYNGDIEEGSIIVASGDRVKVIGADDVMNMIQVDQNSTSSTNLQFVFAGESNLTSAVMSVTDSHPVSVAFAKTMNGTALYNEEEYGDIVNALETVLLERNGYDCTDIDIATDELDVNAYDMIIVAVPSVDFTEDIITKLSDFLYNDGKYDRSMLYIPSLMQTNLPNIAEFLADWSIKVEDNFIVDQTYAIGTATNIVLTITDSEAVGALPNESLPVVAPYSREVSVITKNNEDIVSTVLQSSASSYTCSLLDDSYDEEVASHGVAVMSKKQTAEQFDTYTSTLFVLGSSFITDSELLTQTSTYNNANVLLGILNNMTGKETAAVIPEKTLQHSYIAPTQKQANVIRIIAIWVIPFIVAVIGIAVLVRRRNK